MRAVTLLLTLFISLVSSKFEPYACVGERAVKLKIWLNYKDTLSYQGTIDNELIGYSNVSRKDCAKQCRNFAFMFFMSSDHSETLNCICLRQKDFHMVIAPPNNNPHFKLPRLTINPSDITSQPDSWPNKRCAPGYGYMLSCQITEDTNWC